MVMHLFFVYFSVVKSLIETKQNKTKQNKIKQNKTVNVVISPTIYYDEQIELLFELLGTTGILLSMGWQRHKLSQRSIKLTIAQINTRACGQRVEMVRRIEFHHRNRMQEGFVTVVHTEKRSGIPIPYSTWTKWMEQKE